MICPRIKISEAPLGWRHTVFSVLAAFFGVQSSRNRRRDFSRGTPAAFFAVALLLTGVFAGILMLVVRALLAQAGM